MKNWTKVLLVFLVALGVGFFLARERALNTSAGHVSQVSQSNIINSALTRPDSNALAIIQSNFAKVQTPPPELVKIVPAGPPSALQFTNFDPQIVLENMARAIRQYGTMFGGNPVGTNPEITSQLDGNNPKHIHFLNAEQGMRIDGSGELVDPWGTPYFFHQISGTDMEIHSAGPDRILWTADDLVTH